jgi:peptidyl-prolyl cis-trans isomerase SurA
LNRQPILRGAPALLALAALLLLIGCNRGGGRSGDVVATVNGKGIPRSEVEKYYENQTAGSPQKPTPAQEMALKLNFLRELIDREIMMQRAQKLGLLATDDEVEQKITEIKAPYTQEEFDKRLKDRKLTLDDMKRDIRAQLTIQKLFNREINSKITISDADVTQYYNDHKSEFNLVEPQYHLAHILVVPGSPQPVRNLKNSDARTDAEARDKIRMILNRLESGEDFATVAMNYSEDPSTSSNGGDLGIVPESGLRNTDPATRAEVMKLRPGQFSGIITVVNPNTKQPMGYRIVKVVGKEPAGQRDLEDPRVQQAIREQLRERREQLLKSAYYEIARNEAEVENYLAQEVMNSAGTAQ